MTSTIDYGSSVKTKTDIKPLGRKVKAIAKAKKRVSYQLLLLSDADAQWRC